METSRIKETRKALGLTQLKVQKLLGIPTRTQQGWELGERSPAPWLEEMIIREYRRIAISEENCKE